MQEGDVDGFDQAVQRWFDAWRGSADAVMLAATRGGDLIPMSALAAIALAVLVVCKRLREARYLLVGAGGCLLLNVLLKLVFQRARPNAELPYLLARPGSFSFPSGHTMGSTGVIGCLIVIVYTVHAPRSARYLVSVLGVAAVLLVGCSRVYFGAHYPSDVIAGFLAAGAWLSAVTGWAYPRLLPGES